MLFSPLATSDKYVRHISSKWIDVSVGGDDVWQCSEVSEKFRCRLQTYGRKA